jgi:hypothetical protein
MCRCFSSYSAPAVVDDDALEADLRRVAQAVDPVPDDNDCAWAPEGSPRHDYRITASSYYGTGLDHPDYQAGETCYRCRRCRDVYVVSDADMRALDEERERD